jgi:hypothetical protein
LTNFDPESSREEIHRVRIHQKRSTIPEVAREFAQMQDGYINMNYFEEIVPSEARFHFQGFVCPIKCTTRMSFANCLKAGK